MIKPAVIAAAGFGVLFACAASTMPTVEDGRALYTDYCATCHGDSGRGDGLLAEGLSPAPADLTVIAARNGGAWVPAQVLSQIDGYHRSAPEGVIMPEFGEILSGDTIPLDTGDGRMTPTPRALVALLRYLESIQR